MVRLKAVTPAHVQPHGRGFNSSMVRLKDPTTYIDPSLYNGVSIPVWYD